MRKLSYVLACSVFALTACGGGSGGGSSPLPTGGGTTQSPQSVGSATVSLSFPVKTTSSSTSRKPQYVSSSSSDVMVDILQINGSSSGFPAAVTANNPETINLTTTGGSPNCVVSVGIETCTLTVLAPAGSIEYGFTVQDTLGRTLSAGVATFTITLGAANTGLTVVLNGNDLNASFGAVSLTANTPVSGQTVALNVYDADGNVITGSAAYNSPITVTDTDATGETTLEVNGGSTSSSVTINAPTDVLTINYAGIAIPAFSLEAVSTNDSVNISQPVTPTIQPITFTGSNVALDDAAHGGLVTDPNYNQETLFFTDDTTPESFTPAELGWTNSPYNQSIVISPGGCSGAGILNGLSSSGGLFTATPRAAGVCDLSVNNGVGGSTPLWMSVTSASIGLQ